MSAIDRRRAEAFARGQEDAALGAFARFWPLALKNAREIGLTKSGLDLRTATDLARSVWLAAFHEGGSAALDALREEFAEAAQGAPDAP